LMGRVGAQGAITWTGVVVELVKPKQGGRGNEGKNTRKEETNTWREGISQIPLEDNRVIAITGKVASRFLREEKLNLKGGLPKGKMGEEDLECPGGKGGRVMQRGGQTAEENSK